MSFTIDASPAVAEPEIFRLLRHVARCPLCSARMQENEGAMRRHMLEEQEKAQVSQKEVSP